MKTIYIAMLTAALLLTACAGTGSTITQREDRITNGMTEDSLIVLMGRPIVIYNTPKDNEQVYEYGKPVYGQAPFYVLLREGKVVAVSDHIWSR